MLPDTAVAEWLRDANPNVDFPTFRSRMSRGEVVLAGGGGVAACGTWSRQAVEDAGLSVVGQASSGYEETPRHGEGG